jgi:hypothetical protein
MIALEAGRDLSSLLDEGGSAFHEIVAMQRAIATEVFERVVERTPVDTGRARGNWRIARNEIDDRVDVNEFDPDASEPPAKAAEALEGLRPGDSVNITNGLPYIWSLEHGHSRQAPEGMILLTAAEFPGIVEHAAATLDVSLVR